MPRAGVSFRQLEVLERQIVPVHRDLFNLLSRLFLFFFFLPNQFNRVTQPRRPRVVQPNLFNTLLTALNRYAPRIYDREQRGTI